MPEHQPTKLPDATSRSVPEAAEIQAQLEQILASTAFRSSKRCSDFLRYVVEAAAAGRTDHLKERSLGIAVFERAPDYDTNQDPVVRNTAGQVRRRLAQYYLNSGVPGEVRIEPPAGAYVLEIFKALEPAAGETRTSEARTVRRGRLWTASGLAVILAAAALAIFWMRRTAPDRMEQFWSPLLKQPGPVVVCVGQGHPYRLNGDWDHRFEEAAASGRALQTGSIPLSDVAPAWDRYIGVNDAQALERLTALFTRFGKLVELRGGRNTTLEDLRRKPVVLVGAFNNDWTLRLTGELRFYFESELTQHLDLVRDRLHPGQRAWAVRSDTPTALTPVDYAIVTRVQNPAAEQTVVVAAGLKGAGTCAAGEFVTNPPCLGKALRSAPPGWAGKNVQFVISSTVYSGSPGPPTVVAEHFW